MLRFPIGHASLNVGPADVGRRILVTLHGDDMVQGVLVRWTGGATEGIIRVRRRDGHLIGVRVNDITAARVLSPEVSAFDMERLAQQGWPPMVTETIGDWAMRCSRGSTYRANSARVAAPPPGKKELTARLQRIEAWYREIGLTPRLQIPEPSGMAAELEQLGWKAERSSQLMVNSVPRLLSATAWARERTDLDVEVTDQPNDDWYRLLSGYGPDTREEFHHIMDSVRPAAFVFCRDQSGELLGVGRATLQDTWAGATTIDTASRARRRGIARAVAGHLAVWAHEQGAAQWYLQVYHGEPAVRSFYEKFGFTVHHRYFYWTKD